jgi:hypothetical protein
MEPVQTELEAGKGKEERRNDAVSELSLSLPAVDSWVLQKAMD